ncbi:unnamed protein product [Moneuplotes crassus]|uniref:Uncharacterized protein n=1 Tax=Euplotes crassus TaxID=5936 RepID=A0AAD1U3N8_EUPCR|nr:unnamed protein product [Moneuplotes crassus]
MESQFTFIDQEEKDIDLMQDQKKLIMQILNLQEPSTDEEYEQRNGYDSLGLDEEIMINGVGVPREIFSLKALVIDEPTQRMLSTITKMTDIRDSNVTLHSKITAKRDSVVDTPVIYLIEPTEENIELVVQDAERALYDFMFFYFTRPAPGPALENLACKLARIGAADKVMKVQDNYLSFFCHTQNCFTIYHENAQIQALLNSETSSAIDAEVENIVHGIFGVFEATNFYPIIRFRKGEISETIAYELNALFQEKAEKDESYEFKRQPRKKKRCLLLIFNRDVDWSIMYRHSWSYLPLIHDIIGIKANQIQIQEEGKDKSFDLDFMHDSILKEYALKDTPELGESIEKKLQDWKVKYDEINKKSQSKEVSQIFSNLNSAIDSLPKMKQEKEKIEAHSSICTILYDAVKQRDIDSYDSLEDEIITKSHLSSKARKEMEEILFNINTCLKSGLDRLRLLCIYIIATNPEKGQVQSKIQKLRELCPETNFDMALKIWQKQNPDKDIGDENISSQVVEEEKSIFSGFGLSLKNKGKSLLGNVRNLVENPSSDSMIANLVSQYYDNKGEGKEYENDSYIDTVMNRELNSSRANMLIFDSQNCNSLMTYVTGGGSYYEYQRVTELQEKINKKVIYGCDYIYSPEEFCSKTS